MIMGSQLFCLLLVLVVDDNCAEFVLVQLHVKISLLHLDKGQSRDILFVFAANKHQLSRFDRNAGDRAISHLDIHKSSQLHGVKSEEITRSHAYQNVAIIIGPVHEAGNEPVTRERPRHRRLVPTPVKQHDKRLQFAAVRVNL